MKGNYLTILLVYFLCSFSLIGEVIGSHFRFGSLSWSRDASTANDVYTLILELHIAYRRVQWVGNMEVGDTYGVWDSLYWGDQDSDRLQNLTVTPGGIFFGESSNDDWSDSRGFMKHTYDEAFLNDTLDNNNGLFKIKVQSCCRIGSWDDYTFYTTVNVTEFKAYGASPKASIFPLLTMSSGTGDPMTAKVSASTGDGRALKYEWVDGAVILQLMLMI